MTKFEIGGVLYRNWRDAIDAIAEEWITAGGANSDADVAEAFATMTDEQLAAECIDGWRLDEERHDERNDEWDPEDEESPRYLSVMTRDEWDAADRADAFGRQRAARAVA